MLIGGDTRDSTPTLVRWVAEGLAAGGARMLDAGVLPTPGVARLVVELGADAGVVVSASHNPYPDNGIKLIDREGFKWGAAAERKLEARIAGARSTPAKRAREHAEIEPAHGFEAELQQRYGSALLGTLATGRPLDGLRLAVDAANGATAPLATWVFEAAGARVEVMADHPDGRNINCDCGSTHPEGLAALCRDTGSQLGLAFDGDGDRVVVCDEAGTIHDGDAVLYLWARALKESGKLGRSRVVATVMSNLGLGRALQHLGIDLVSCEVGDRAVVATLRSEGLLLGGEQSGHIVHLGLATTGDGLLSALHLAALLAESGRPLSELLAEFRRYPQVLRSVPVCAKPDLDSLTGLTRARQAVERRLGSEGRLLLRYSGTEPVLRIMIEGPDEAAIEAWAQELEAAVNREIGA